MSSSLNNIILKHLQMCLNRRFTHKCVPVALVTYDPVSDLEADHAQQQEGREEGVEENKV